MRNATWVAGVMLVGLAMGCGPRDDDIWRVSGRRLDTAGMPLPQVPLKLSVLKGVTSPNGLAVPTEEFGVLATRNTDATGHYAVSLTRKQYEYPAYGDSTPLRVEGVEARERQQSYLEFYLVSDPVQDITLPDLVDWNSSAVFQVTSGTLSATYQLPPSAQAPPGRAGALQTLLRQAFLSLVDQHGGLIWREDVGEKTAVSVTALRAEDLTAVLQVEVDRNYQLLLKPALLAPAHSYDSVNLVDRVWSIPFAYPANVPVSRGQACLFDGVEQKPCRLTDGNLSDSGVGPSAAKTVELRFAHAVHPAHVLIRNLLVQVAAATATPRLSLEGSNDGAIWTPLGTLDTDHASWFDVVPPANAAPVTALRLATSGGVIALAEVSVFE